MLIADNTWEAIREQFSEEEKAAMRAVVQGQCICPRGVVIDEDGLDEALRQKLQAAKQKQVGRKKS